MDLVEDKLAENKAVDIAEEVEEEGTVEEVLDLEPQT